MGREYRQHCGGAVAKYGNSRGPRIYQYYYYILQQIRGNPGKECWTEELARRRIFCGLIS